jgi:hypothetical protein
MTLRREFDRLCGDADGSQRVTALPVVDQTAFLELFRPSLVMR